MDEWYCSTSTEPVIYNCNLRDVKIVNHEGVSSIESFTFSLSMNRGEATSSLTSPNRYFSIEDTGRYLLLSNSYSHPKENYYSRALYKLRLDSSSLSLEALDSNLLANGHGKCAIKT